MGKIPPFFGWLVVWEEGTCLTTICQKREIAENWALEFGCHMAKQGKFLGEPRYIQVVIQDAETVNKKILNACIKNGKYLPNDRPDFNALRAQAERIRNQEVGHG